MARKVTQQVVAAFLDGSRRTVGNTSTDGTRLMLHGNVIASRALETQKSGVEVERLCITLAGWNTSTTRERLNGLPGVRVHTKAGQAYLNGEPWDGNWIKLA